MFEVAVADMPVNDLVSSECKNVPSVNKCKEELIVNEDRCCPNHFYDLLTGLSASLAWPIVVVIIFLMLKHRVSRLIDYIVDLIPSTNKFSAGTDGIVWERSIETIRNEAEKLDRTTGVSGDPLIEANYNLAKVYPRGAILEAWNSIEASMFNFVTHNITFDGSLRKMSTRLPEELLKKGSISKEQYAKLRELVVARNQAVHGEITPTTADAIAYLKVASEMHAVIRAMG